MADSIISAEDLGKRYTIRHLARKPSESFREAISCKANLLWSRLTGGGAPESETSGSAEDFWALKGVNFGIKQGEVVGIIGRNGAGKSTLLKILSRITEPTEGRIRLRGRVASLLEVGTGFHPELTGRENIFLNGAILGMTKAEIRSKSDEIVAFSEVEKFLDTPVKRYSSGMYVRLAFAVAAHLEPEILIVDEVLAVGDTEFQKKCLGKMKDVSGHGRTVLFVSHNMTAVSALCDRAILLKAGRVIQDGSAAEVIGGYLESTGQTSGLQWKGPEGDENAQVLHARVCGGTQGTLTTDQPITLELGLHVQQPIHGLVVGWEIWSQREQLLAYSLADDTHSPPTEITQSGHYRLQMEIPADTLASGDYRCCLDIGIHNIRRIVPEKSICLEFHVENTVGIGRRYLTNAWTNIFRPRWKWTGLDSLS